MPQNNMNCQLCRGISVRMHNKYPGYQEPDTFEIYYCPNCNTSHSSPCSDTTGIYEKIYSSGNEVPGYNRYWEYARKVKNIDKPLDYLADAEETYWSVRETLSKHAKNKKTARILEIGSGLGYLTYSLIKANYNAIGIDISKTVVKLANENYGEYFICADLFEFAQLHSESFEIVILTEVIEHVRNPIDFLESVIKLLKPEGKAFITTPNKSIYSPNAIWETELPPVHCWWLSEKSMKYIAENMNLNLSFIDFSEYYKRNYRSVNLNGQTSLPILNKNGDLIVKQGGQQSSIISVIRHFMTNTPYIRGVYKFLIKLIYPKIYICSNKGIVLGAVFQKK